MTVVTDPRSTRRLPGKPRVVVTRRLLPQVEARMAELFDAQFNQTDTPLTREELVSAMTSADVLVPTVTDRIDAAMIAQAIAAPGGRRI
ncbi:MAG TPA: hypothetical protein VN222_16310, partial [Novosphingobium sp.]|nr:hypothetical protein [Novosphingobium sp.]